MATSTTTSSVDPWLQRFYQENANRLSQQYDLASQIYNANSAYQPYTGARVQDFTADQLKGMQMVRDQIGIGQDALSGAVSRAGQAAQSYSDKMPVTADTVNSYFQAYLGRSPDAQGLQDFVASNKTVADLERSIANSPEARARLAAGYTPDLSKLQDGTFRPNAVKVDAFNQALGANVIDPAMATASTIGDRTPQIGALGQVQGGGYQADQIGARDINPAQQIQGGGYRPDSVVADQLGQMQQLANREFDSSAASQYMNPYTSTALQATLSEMSRQNDMGRLADQGRAAKAGAFGGSRQAIVQAERDRNFGKAVADTSARAFDQAYQQAQQQFNTDIGRGLQAGQFNIGTELNRQQQNQQANLQASQANQAAGARAAEFGLGQNLQAQVQNVANEQQRQAQNQSAALQAAQANQSANAAASQFGLNQGMQAQQTNVANELARQQANQAAGLQSLQLDQNSLNQINLANQQARNSMALANEANRQQVFNTNAANFFANQQNAFNTQAQNQNMALQAFNANRDQFNTDQTRQLASGQLAGQLAPQMQSMAMQDANNLLATGGLQQNLGQQNLTTAYQDFLNQRAYPYQNFGFLQGALQGQNYNPYQSQQTQTTQSPNPSALGQAAGLGMTALGVVGATGGFGSNGWLNDLKFW